MGKTNIIKDKHPRHNVGAGQHIGNMLERAQARMLGAMGRGGSFIRDQTNYRQHGTGGRRNNTNRRFRQTHSQWGVWTFNSADIATAIRELRKLKRSKVKTQSRHEQQQTATGKLVMDGNGCIQSKKIHQVLWSSLWIGEKLNLWPSMPYASLNFPEV